jgi:hypothetical protein
MDNSGSSHPFRIRRFTWLQRFPSCPKATWKPSWCCCWRWMRKHWNHAWKNGRHLWPYRSAVGGPNNYIYIIYYIPLFKYIYIYVCMYANIYVYIYIYKCKYIHIYTCRDIVWRERVTPKQNKIRSGNERWQAGKS